MPLTFEQVTARRVRYLRERLGWSQQDLVDKLTNFGMPVDRAQIARLELGKRGISLNETMRLAFALNVAPVQLITDPEEDGESMHPVTGAEITPDEARKWVRGEMPLPFQDARSYWMNVPQAEFERYQLGKQEGAR